MTRFLQHEASRRRVISYSRWDVTNTFGRLPQLFVGAHTFSHSPWRSKVSYPRIELTGTILISEFSIIIPRLIVKLRFPCLRIPVYGARARDLWCIWISHEKPWTRIVGRWRKWSLTVLLSLQVRLSWPRISCSTQEPTGKKGNKTIELRGNSSMIMYCFL